MVKESSGKREGNQPEDYKVRLLNKLNCLIAVLEVAIEKIKKSLAAPEANVKRLTKIQQNLENTLGICLRARETLIKKGGLQASASQASSCSHGGEPKKNLSQPLPKEGGREEPQAPSLKKVKMSFRDYVELSSVQEYRKFKKLPPIQPKDLMKVDLDELIKKLMTG